MNSSTIDSITNGISRCKVSPDQLTPEIAAKLLLPMINQKYRYEANTGTWYQFDGKKMVECSYIRGVVFSGLFDLATLGDIDSEIRTQIDKKRHNDSFIRQTGMALENSTELHASINDFDSDPNLLNTPVGVYNVETGERFDHGMKYLCRRITKVAPLDDEDGKNCPNYMNHVQLVCKSDPEPINWMEELSGYILTGHTFQKEIYLWYGGDYDDLAGIWAYILDEYYCPTHLDQFSIRGKRTVHPTYDFQLIGKRFVTNCGINRGRWNEEKLESVRLSESIEAKQMYGRTVQFKPVFKLLCKTVGQPRLDSINPESVKNLRMMGFPWLSRSASSLQSNLIPEAPYILNRMMKNAKNVIQARKIKTPNIINLMLPVQGALPC